jgi:hypothetical protein
VYLEAVVLGEQGVLLVALRGVQGLAVLLVVDVADPLEEEQGEDVGLELGSVYGPAEDMARRRARLRVALLTSIFWNFQPSLACARGRLPKWQPEGLSHPLLD